MLEDLKGRKHRNELCIFFLRVCFQLIFLRQALQSTTNCSEAFKSRFCYFGQDANVLKEEENNLVFG